MSAVDVSYFSMCTVTSNPSLHGVTSTHPSMCSEILGPRKAPKNDPNFLVLANTPCMVIVFWVAIANLLLVTKITKFTP